MCANVNLVSPPLCGMIKMILLQLSLQLNYTHQSYLNFFEILSDGGMYKLCNIISYNYFIDFEKN